MGKQCLDAFKIICPTKLGACCPLATTTILKGTSDSFVGAYPWNAPVLQLAVIDPYVANSVRCKAF